ncbi:hypothetical protein ThidrDRAFT_4566 [Thiorhodococcus drewsii AZ1]|uniref:Uncharacterized protein n=1 Tax=Thiorhodococcus drewsii AZ1 TaxID=765913 RepID=G2E8F2_9GAMM|nr:hypothetical protein [Thiorhodococcus drewsii]EGV27620.1 hypothetical protein ThidrDRAFT_4566 [Thiorhodococcus drewsii AZ1]
MPTNSVQTPVKTAPVTRYPRSGRPANIDTRKPSPDYGVVRARVEALREHSKNLCGSYSQLLERLRDRSFRLDQHKIAFHERWRQPPERNADEVALYEETKTNLKREEAEIEASYERAEQMEARSSAATGLVAQCERWFEKHAEALVDGALELAPVSADTKATPAQLNQTRTQIETAERHLASLDGVPTSATDRKALLSRAVKERTQHFESRLRIPEATRCVDDIDFNHLFGAWHGEVSDFWGLICWLHGEALVKKLAAVEAEDGPSEAERLAQIEQLRADLEEAYRLEESLCRGLETSGMQVDRRADAPPEVVLAPAGGR